MKTIDDTLLDQAIQRIVTALNPRKIYLYGSRAYGEPHLDSDLDLLIVVSDTCDSTHSQATEAYQALRGLFLPVEIKVVTQSEYQRRAQWQSSIERVVSEKGKVLYGADTR